MNVRELIIQLEEIEDAHGNIEVDSVNHSGMDLVHDVTFDEGYASINYTRFRGAK